VSIAELPGVFSSYYCVLSNMFTIGSNALFCSFAASNTHHFFGTHTYTHTHTCTHTLTHTKTHKNTHASH